MRSTASVPTTAEQLLAQTSESPCELVRGELVEMVPPGFDHGEVAFALGFLIGQFVRENDLGRVVAAETGFLLERDPDTVRAPDIAFVRKSRLPDGPRPGYFEGAPDLAVEVISPHDTASAVGEKVADWLRHGAELVWVADPQTRTITAYHPDRRAEIHDVDDTLRGDPVLPGLALSPSTLFVGR